MFEPTQEVSSANGLISVRPLSVEHRPPGSGSPLSLVPERTAVIVVDVQRAFTEAPPFAAMREIVPRIYSFLTVARSSGMTIVHVKTEFQTDMEDAGRQGSRTRQMMNGILRPGETMNPLSHGSPASEIVPELTPLSSDLVVIKTRFSGFWNTNLHEVLTSRNIETLVFAGGTTTVCVESTLRDALFLEYNALVLSDCTADIFPELHESALSRIDLFFGWVCGSEELIGALRSSAIRDNNIFELQQNRGRS